MKPIKRGKRFFNDDKETVFWRLAGVVKTFFYVASLEFRRKRRQFLRKDQNISEWFAKDTVSPRSKEPVITWLGHATFLIQIDNINILTDPVLLGNSRLYPRQVPVPISLEALPPIDIIVLSHNHFDHFDPKTLNALAQKNNSTMLVPYGDKVRMKQLGFSKVHELEWGESTCISGQDNTIKCSFLPAHHWSGTGAFDVNKSLWGSWLFQGEDKTVYFAGDTAYSDHFSWIKDNAPAIDIAIMPIGPLHPQELMLESHTSAHEAVKAFEVLDATHFIPMHWGTFRPANDNFEDPINQLKESWAGKQRDGKQLHIVKFGERVSFD